VHLQDEVEDDILWKFTNNEHYSMIRLKPIYNFLCSMLVLTPFALSFFILCGIFMHFPELIH
jgi:hypothetical protein